MRDSQQRMIYCTQGGPCNHNGRQFKIIYQIDDEICAWNIACRFPSQWHQNTSDAFDAQESILRREHLASIEDLPEFHRNTLSLRGYMRRQGQLEADRRDQIEPIVHVRAFLQEPAVRGDKNSVMAHATGFNRFHRADLNALSFQSADYCGRRNSLADACIRCCYKNPFCHYAFSVSALINSMQFAAEPAIPYDSGSLDAIRSCC